MSLSWSKQIVLEYEKLLTLRPCEHTKPCPLARFLTQPFDSFWPAHKDQGPGDY